MAGAGDPRARLVLVARIDCDDDIPLLVATFDIAMGLGELLERIASIDNGLQPSRLDEISKEGQVIR